MPREFDEARLAPAPTKKHFGFDYDQIGFAAVSSGEIPIPFATARFLGPVPEAPLERVEKHLDLEWEPDVEAGEAETDRPIKEVRIQDPAPEREIVGQVELRQADPDRIRRAMQENPEAYAFLQKLFYDLFEGMETEYGVCPPLTEETPE